MRPADTLAAGGGWSLFPTLGGERAAARFEPPTPSDPRIRSAPTGSAANVSRSARARTALSRLNG